MASATTPSFEAFANGRVNLIGEHTDYNGGWVLPTAIPQKTNVRIRLRADMTVVARSTMKGTSEVRYELGSETKSGQWFDYLQGATHILAKTVAGKRSAAPGSASVALPPLCGFEIEIDSTVPTGSGLSSSAAFEIAVLKALRDAFRLDISNIELAKIGQRIENEFVGANVGIMDQMACALAKFGEALFLDTHLMTYESITIPMGQIDLIVINSGVEHNHAGGDYNARVAECKSACVQLGVASLREVTPAIVEASTALGLVEKKRARHVVTENVRVHDAVRALKAKDFETLGRLFGESHASMRDDYAVSVPEVDLLVELCQALPSVYGARLTGGGFGGSIVAIAKKGEGLKAAQAVVSTYESQVPFKATILVP